MAVMSGEGGSSATMRQAARRRSKTKQLEKRQARLGIEGMGPL
jgi:hypothetical protein